jgi:hypothetical protein
VTGDQLRDLIAALARTHGWPREGQTTFARLVGVDIRRLKTWLAGKHPVGGEALCLALAMRWDASLVDALWDEYRTSRLALPGPLDRLLWALQRDPALVGRLRRQRR